SRDWSSDVCSSDLAGVDDSGVGTGNLVHQPARGGGNAAHALHAVEHQAFRSQNRARRAFYAESDIAAPDGGAIFECDLNQKPEIEMGEYPPGEKDSGKNTILLYQEFGRCRLIRIDRTKRRMVPFTNVFLQSLLNEPIQVFISNVVRHYRAKIDRTRIL